MPDVIATIEALKQNGFNVWHVSGRNEVKPIFQEEILDVLKPKIVGFGDSMTVEEVGLIKLLDESEEISMIKLFNEEHSWGERIQDCRDALQSDLFLTGSNAITEKGHIINLDMVGNRIAGIAFGPRHVVIVVSTKKFVKSLEDGMKRVKKAAVLNAKRHPDLNLPCAKTGICMDCNSPNRICNTWQIVEKSYPKGRINIIIIDEDLGL